MANTSITGSEAARLSVIQDNWLVFEPISNYKYAANSGLFSVDIGQRIKPDVVIYSGSINTASGTFTVEKDIHIFYDETDALEFVNNVGEDNLLSFQELVTEDDLGKRRTIFEAHVVNNPFIELEFKNNNVSQNLGFKIDVLISGTVLDSSRITLEEATKKIVLNKKGELVSDTYERFFAIETDKK
jgi:hypothetical protein